MTKDKKAKDTSKNPKNIANLEARVTELENSWKRALADYQNLQKRTAEERIEFVKYANQTLILKLLTILDNLELTQKHTPNDGVAMIIKEFQRVLSEEGLEEITTTGKDFDQTTMEAVEMVEGESGKVVGVIQKGYKFNNKVLRPAKVKVGKGKL